MIRNLLCKSRNFRPTYTSFSHLHQPKCHNNTLTKRRKGKKNQNNSFQHSLTSTEWIQVSGIPPLSSLDEILTDIERIINTELQTGIVDLDAAEAMVFDQVEKQKENEEYSGEITVSSPTSAPLPLWDPSNHTYNDNGDMALPDHMVLEAHLKLSTLYRQSGWYLRFPNRSCVHAILSHVNEAERIKNEQKNKLKQIRKKAALSMKKRWQSSDNVEDNSELVDEHEFYTEMDNFSWMDYETRPLRCGWKEVKVRPFDLISDKFYSKIDWIDDTVVRVENCPVDSTVDDLRYFLKQYNIVDDILTFTDYSNDGKLKLNNFRKEGVQLVVSGSKNNHRVSTKDIDRDTTLSTTNTFLVKFATAADARCAVREKQSVSFMGLKLRLAQFPCQIIQ